MEPARAAGSSGKLDAMDLGWIWAVNLRPLLMGLCILAGYRFDDSDWIAVERGMRGTDSEVARGSGTPSVRSR